MQVPIKSIASHDAASNMLLPVIPGTSNHILSMFLCFTVHVLSRHSGEIGQCRQLVAPSMRWASIVWVCQRTKYAYIEDLNSTECSLALRVHCTRCLVVLPVVYWIDVRKGEPVTTIDLAHRKLHYFLLWSTIREPLGSGMSTLP